MNEYVDAGDLFDVVLDANGNIIGVISTPIDMEKNEQGTYEMKKGGCK